MLLQPESIPFTDETAFLCAFLAVFKAFFTILPTTFFSLINPLPAYPSGTQPVPFFHKNFVCTRPVLRFLISIARKSCL